VSLKDVGDRLSRVDSLLEKIEEVNERGLLRDERFRFRPRLRTTLQLACLVERVNRIFAEKRQTGAGFLDVARAFDTVWVKGLLHMLPFTNFSSYM
jgi:hypothetical protein